MRTFTIGQCSSERFSSTTVLPTSLPKPLHNYRQSSKKLYYASRNGRVFYYLIQCRQSKLWIAVHPFSKAKTPNWYPLSTSTWSTNRNCRVSSPSRPPKHPSCSRHPALAPLQHSPQRPPSPRCRIRLHLKGFPKILFRKIYWHRCFVCRWLADSRRPRLSAAGLSTRYLPRLDLVALRLGSW